MSKALGRGLEVILPKYSKDTSYDKKNRGGPIMIPVDRITPNRYQARRNFDESKIKELSASIKMHGLAQPIIVTPSAVPGDYELIAGERRLRAAKLAGLKEVPAIVRDSDKKTQFHLSLAENIQREDLNPIEEALAYKNLMKEFGYTQEELSRIVGKERSVIANTLRLLNLPEEIQSMIEDGVLSPAHGRTLAALSDDPQKQKELLKKIVDGHLTVREVEHIVSEIKKSSTGSNADVNRIKKNKRSLPPELSHLETSLESIFHTKIRLIGSSKRGKIVFHYYSLEDLERLARTLKKAAHIR